MTKTLYLDTCPVVVTWRAVKHFTLRLSHTTGQVHLSAPLRATEAQVLKVIAAKANWIAKVYAKGQKAIAEHEEVLDPSLQTYLEEELRRFIPKWSGVLKVKVSEIRIKQVRSYWGKCFPRTRRVYFALRLAKYPTEVIEYIVVHELLHFHIHNHGDSFHRAMDRLLPDWRLRDQQLKKR